MSKRQASVCSDASLKALIKENLPPELASSGQTSPSISSPQKQKQAGVDANCSAVPLPEDPHTAVAEEQDISGTRLGWAPGLSLEERLICQPLLGTHERQQCSNPDMDLETLRQENRRLGLQNAREQAIADAFDGLQRENLGLKAQVQEVAALRETVEELRRETHDQRQQIDELKRHRDKVVPAPSCPRGVPPEAERLRAQDWEIAELRAALGALRCENNRLEGEGREAVEASNALETENQRLRTSLEAREQELAELREPAVVIDARSHNTQQNEGPRVLQSGCESEGGQRSRALSVGSSSSMCVQEKRRRASEVPARRLIDHHRAPVALQADFVAPPRSARGAGEDGGEEDIWANRRARETFGAHNAIGRKWAANLILGSAQCGWHPQAQRSPRNTR